MDVLTAPAKVMSLKTIIIVAGILALLLIGSAAGNALLFSEWQGAVKRATTAEANLANANRATEQANSNTKACNDSIGGLEAAARKAGEEAGTKRAAAQKKSLELQEQAQRELSTPATVPGDDYKSAQDRVSRILRARGKP